jgi:hypothetical protein
MGQQSKGDDNLVRKTLITTAAMMGASVVFVGGLSLIASSAAGKAVGAPSESSSSLVPADKISPASLGGASPNGVGTTHSPGDTPAPPRVLPHRSHGGISKPSESP